jgi:hypothetical protein
MVHIWLTNPLTPVLTPDLEAFKHLPHTIQQLLLDCSNKRVFVYGPVPSGEHSVPQLMNNLKNYIIPDSGPFEAKAIQWCNDLLLGQDHANHQKQNHAPSYIGILLNGTKNPLNGLIFCFSPLYVCILPGYCLESEINSDFSYFAKAFTVLKWKSLVYKL